MGVTLQDVAKAMKLDKSTVSRALRNNARVSAATRERVRTVAEAMGYRPDPMLSALAERRKSINPEGTGRVIAFIAAGRRNHPEVFEEHIRHARVRAGFRGYRLEIFELENYPPKPRLMQVLWNRGVFGIIIGPTQIQVEDWGIDWQYFAGVISGSSRSAPPLDSVVQDERGAIKQMLSRAGSLGYARTGFLACVLDPLHFDDESRISAALFHQAKVGQLNIPVLELPYTYEPETTLERIEAWIREHKLDAIVSNNIRPFYTLTEAGWKIPEDLGFACQRQGGQAALVSGTSHCDEEIAATAVDVLDSKIRANERGIPARPKRILVPVFHEDGPSMREQ